MKTDNQNNVGKPIVTHRQQRQYVPKERLSEYLSEVSVEDIPWAVYFLVNKLSAKKEEEFTHTHHVWEHYQLSPEIQALSSFERRSLPDDYDKALTTILKGKYK